MHLKWDVHSHGRDCTEGLHFSAFIKLPVSYHLICTHTPRYHFNIGNYNLPCLENPQCACIVRVTVVCWPHSCVCVSVCLSVCFHVSYGIAQFYTKTKTHSAIV